MTYVLALAEATWLGIAAAVSSISGVVLAWVSHRQGAKSARRQAEKETYEELLAARKEAQDLAAELHKMKMEKFGDSQG